MSVPSSATQSQINAMNKAAAEMMAKDGFVMEPDETPTHPEVMHPSLAPVQEPEMFEEEQVENDTPETQDQVLEEPETAFAYNDHSSNLRKMAKAKLEAERERDEMMRKLIAYQEQQQQYYAPKKEQPVEIDPFDSLEDDSLIEGKHLKEMAREIKNLKKNLQEQQQYSSRTSQDALDLKLRSQYPDIDRVLTPENIELFRDLDPDLAETIGNNQDMYKKAALAYKMIKQYGIYKDNSFEKDKAVVAKNHAKPKPLASVSPQQSDSPLSHANAFANGLTDTLKEQLRKEMYQARKAAQ